MKNLLELYKLTLIRFKQANDLFICNTIERLPIATKETELLLEHFHSQYPSETQYIEFFNHGSFNKDNKSGSWFKNYRVYKHTEMGDLSSFQIRIKLLEAIIEKIESENK